MSRTLDTARAAWGETMPDWVAALARACDAESQAAVAQRLGYSHTLVSLLVNGKYSRDLRRVERQVREILMRATVECPVKGEIEAAECREHQAAPFTPSNPTRVALYRACRNGCPHSALAERKAS